MLALRWERFQRHVEPETTGVSVPHISTTQVLEYKVPLPTLGRQSQIVRQVHQATTRIDGLERTLVQQNERLREYRQALITAAVTGQLDVTARQVQRPASNDVEQLAMSRAAP